LEDDMNRQDTTKRDGRTQVRAARAIGYVRVSRVGGRGGEGFISPELQRETIASKARAGGLELVELVEDLDESGGKYERPGFQRALEAVERGEASVIVVARLTRFARSVLDTHRALERLEAAGGRLVACDIDVDVSTPQGRLIRNTFATLAQFELELAREQWQAAKANAVGRGVKISARAPFGYRFTGEHRLEPSDDRETLVELFRRRAAGTSWRLLVAWFAGETGRTVAPATLAHMVANRAYLGEVTYAELVKVDAHEALVDVELWEAAQRPSADWKAGRPTKAAGARSLLAGIARCASCGSGLGSTTSGHGKRVYRCANGQCARRVSILGPSLDELVAEQLLERVRTTLRAAWPALPLEDRRRLLGVCVGELVVDRGVRGHADLSKRVRLVFGEPGKGGAELAP
jgi:DNA invertase Pin-like site-specific DNA recombinase